MSLPDTLDSSAFSSLYMLREEHSKLLMANRDVSDSLSNVSAALEFLKRGQVTGILLDMEGDRQAAQSLLNFWMARLYRAGVEPPETILADFDPALAPELPDTACPYLGLDPFLEENHSFFAGRQQLVDKLLALLSSQTLLAVLGSSGSGKSSLVRAGMIPALKAGRLPGSENWHYFQPIVPGTHPLRNIARIASSTRADEAWLDAKAETYRRDPLEFARSIASSSHGSAVITVDQFEEVFTLCRDEESRQTFVACLTGLLRDGHYIILTMRTDFESRVALLPEFQHLFEHAAARVTPMSAGELREAIEVPAKLVGLRFEQGVVDKLLSDILGEPAALPLLQFTLLKLWENRERNRITWAAYRRLGGAHAALANTANELYDNLIPEEQVTIRRILLHLVRPGDGLETTSNRVQRSALYRSGEAHDRIDRVLSKLINARLLRVTDNEGQADTDVQIEVAHEALVRNWPRLVGWLDDERDSLRARQRLTSAADQWIRLKKDPSGLRRGKLLDESLQYDDLSEAEAEFVQASIRAQETETAEREARQRHELEVARKLAATENLRATEQLHANRRLRVALVGILILFLFSLAATALAIQQGLVALSRQLAGQAQGLMADNPQVGVLLALEAQRFWPTGEAANVLAQAPYVYPPLQATLRTDGTSAIASLSWSPDSRQLADASSIVYLWNMDTNQLRTTLTDHTDIVNSVAWSPDGSSLASGSKDHTLKIWNANNGQASATLSARGEEINAVAWSPDSKLLAAASLGAIVIWDVSTRQTQLILLNQTEFARLAWSPDGKLLASTTGSHVTIWDISTGKVFSTLRGQDDVVKSMAWSPDGRWLATGYYRGSVVIWDIAGNKPHLTLGNLSSGRCGGFVCPGVVVTWSPNSQQFVTGEDDGTVIIWDMASGQQSLKLGGHDKPVSALAWSPDGQRLASGDYDGFIIIWDLAGGQAHMTLAGHTNIVNNVAWSPDSKLLASVSGEVVIVRDVSSWQPQVFLKGDNISFYSIAWSPDGKQLASSGYNSFVIWDVASGQPRVIVNGQADSVAWSPDGKQIATGGLPNGNVIIRDAATGVARLTLTKHTGLVDSIAWSPDGTMLASHGIGNPALVVWDAASGLPFATLAGGSFAWSPTGQQLAFYMGSGSLDKGRIVVWDVATRRVQSTMQGTVAYVSTLAWSPDGKQIAAGSFLNLSSNVAGPNIRVWDVATGRESTSIRTHADRVYSLAWSPDGKFLAVTDGFEVVLISTRFTHAPCNWLSRNLTQDEWQQYFPSYLTYHKTCESLQ